MKPKSAFGVLLLLVGLGDAVERFQFFTPPSFSTRLVTLQASAASYSESAAHYELNSHHGNEVKVITLSFTFSNGVLPSIVYNESIRYRNYHSVFDDETVLKKSVGGAQSRRVKPVNEFTVGNKTALNVCKVFKFHYDDGRNVAIKIDNELYFGNVHTHEHELLTSSTYKFSDDDVSKKFKFSCIGNIIGVEAIVEVTGFDTAPPPLVEVQEQAGFSKFLAEKATRLSDTKAVFSDDQLKRSRIDVITEKTLEEAIGKAHYVNYNFFLSQQSNDKILSQILGLGKDVVRSDSVNVYGDSAIREEYIEWLEKKLAACGSHDSRVIDDQMGKTDIIEDGQQLTHTPEILYPESLTVSRPDVVVSTKRVTTTPVQHPVVQWTLPDFPESLATSQSHVIDVSSSEETHTTLDPAAQKKVSLKHMAPMLDDTTYDPLYTAAAKQIEYDVVQNETLIKSDLPSSYASTPSAIAGEMSSTSDNNPPPYHADPQTPPLPLPSSLSKSDRTTIVPAIPKHIVVDVSGSDEREEHATRLGRPVEISSTPLPRMIPDYPYEKAAPEKEARSSPSSLNAKSSTESPYELDPLDTPFVIPFSPRHQQPSSISPGATIPTDATVTSQKDLSSPLIHVDVSSSSEKPRIPPSKPALSGFQPSSTQVPFQHHTKAHDSSIEERGSTIFRKFSSPSPSDPIVRPLPSVELLPPLATGFLPSSTQQTSKPKALLVQTPTSATPLRMEHSGSTKISPLKPSDVTTASSPVATKVSKMDKQLYTVVTNPSEITATNRPPMIEVPESEEVGNTRLITRRPIYTQPPPASVKAGLPPSKQESFVDPLTSPSIVTAAQPSEQESDTSYSKVASLTDDAVQQLHQSAPPRIPHHHSSAPEVGVTTSVKELTESKVTKMRDATEIYLPSPTPSIGITVSRKASDATLQPVSSTRALHHRFYKSSTSEPLYQAGSGTMAVDQGKKQSKETLHTQPYSSFGYTEATRVVKPKKEEVPYPVYEETRSPLPYLEVSSSDEHEDVATRAIHYKSVSLPPRVPTASPQPPQLLSTTPATIEPKEKEYHSVEKIKTIKPNTGTPPTVPSSPSARRITETSQKQFSRSLPKITPHESEIRASPIFRGTTESRKRVIQTQEASTSPDFLLTGEGLSTKLDPRLIPSLPLTTSPAPEYTAIPAESVQDFTSKRYEHHYRRSTAPSVPRVIEAIKSSPKSAVTQIPSMVLPQSEPEYIAVPAEGVQEFTAERSEQDYRSSSSATSKHPAIFVTTADPEYTALPAEVYSTYNETVIVKGDIAPKAGVTTQLLQKPPTIPARLTSLASPTPARMATKSMKIQETIVPLSSEVLSSTEEPLFTARAKVIIEDITDREIITHTLKPNTDVEIATENEPRVDEASAKTPITVPPYSHTRKSVTHVDKPSVPLSVEAFSFSPSSLSSTTQDKYREVDVSSMTSTNEKLSSAIPLSSSVKPLTSPAPIASSTDDEYSQIDVSSKSSLTKLRLVTPVPHDVDPTSDVSPMIEHLKEHVHSTVEPLEASTQPVSLQKHGNISIPTVDDDSDEQPKVEDEILTIDANGTKEHTHTVEDYGKDNKTVKVDPPVAVVGMARSTPAPLVKITATVLPHIFTVKPKSGPVKPESSEGSESSSEESKEVPNTPASELKGVPTKSPETGHTKKKAKTEVEETFKTREDEEATDGKWVFIKKRKKSSRSSKGRRKAVMEVEKD